MASKITHVALAQVRDAADFNTIVARMAFVAADASYFAYRDAETKARKWGYEEVARREHAATSAGETLVDFSYSVMQVVAEMPL